MGMFDRFPVPKEKAHLIGELSRVDECWNTTRFDSLPHVVRILTSRNREGELEILKEQIDVVEEVVDEVVHTYHGGFNKAIQNYSQILRLFSESSESIESLKDDLAESKRRLSARNTQLHQLWYRSVTLRHIISSLDQIEGIAQVPARIEKLISDKQFYAAVQLHIQSALMLEREGLQTVGALQDIRSELAKLHGKLFLKVLEDLHAHLYNKGEYSSVASSMLEKDDEVPTTTSVAIVEGSYGMGSINGGSLTNNGSSEPNDEKLNGGDGKDGRASSQKIPVWLFNSTPDEFVETIKKSDAPVHVKYLQTMVECLGLLHKVPAAGALMCQRLRPTVHEIITSRIKAHAHFINSSRSGIDQVTRTGTTSLEFLKGLESYQLSKQKRQHGLSLAGTLLAVSPVSPVMAPTGKSQVAAKELLDSILDCLVRIFGNHVVVGELIESKSSPQGDMRNIKPMSTDGSFDFEASQVIGRYSIGFSMTVLQSEIQQLICEILRATPEAASADAAAQTARLAKEKGDGSEDGLAFSFRFTDATSSAPNQGANFIRQGWSKKGSNVQQEGYGSAAVLPEQGIYLAASIYRPVHQFTDRIASMLPKMNSQLSNDGLLSFVETFVKDHLLPTMFVDYRKSVQQAISSKFRNHSNPVGPAAFRPRANPNATYASSIEKGRPVLQGLVAIDFLAKEVLAWAQAMPKFAAELMKHVQTFLERTFERCRTSYTEAVLEKQSYMVIGRHDIDKLMRRDPASACLPSTPSQFNVRNSSYESFSTDVESELCDLLLNLRPIKQENLIRDNNKLVLLASLSDSLEYVADSIERLVQMMPVSANQMDNGMPRRTSNSPSQALTSFANEYRKLAIDCLKVLRVEMQLETIFYLQQMTHREYLENQDAEEPDDFVNLLAAQITRRDEEIAPFVAGAKRNYIFGGICSIAGNASIKALVDIKSINLFGVQQICRNAIALEQSLAAVPSIDGEAIKQKLEHVRNYYELLNMKFEALLAFVTEHGHMFTLGEYINLLKVHIPGREIPPDAVSQLKEALSR